MDPHSHSDLAQGRIKHIKLRISADFDKRRLRIRADYQLDSPVEGPFTLDSRGAEISRIYSGTQAIEWGIERRDPILGEQLQLKDLRHSDAFTIELTTAADARALQWLQPAQTAGGKHPFLYSQCQPLHARSIFPCQDTPSVRFTYEAELDVPKGLTAVMAAGLTGARTEGDRTVYSFSMPQPIPAYLFAFGVGDIQFRVIGPRTGIWAEPAQLEEAAWEFAENEEKVIAAEQLFGPYRWERYDMLVMPPSFPIGGMENPRLTFVTSLALCGDRSMSSLVTHELAHAWTGNLVTNATWEDFWINEGWTTYAEGRISEVIMGTELVQLEHRVSLNRLWEDMRDFGPDSIHNRLKVPMQGVDPDQVFSVVPYNKGELFLMSLERAAGREAFDAFIQRYITKYSFRSITTEEFIEFVTSELPEVPKRVDMRAWVYEPRLPEDIVEPTPKLYEQVLVQIKGYAQGRLPVKADVQGWHTIQKELFLDMLPAKVSPDHCRYFDELFDFQKARHTMTMLLFYRLCIRSEYKAVLPSIERFVRRVGREYLLTRLFRCLVENEWTKGLARPMFEGVRETHHPITVAVLDSLLKKAGV
jgi:aminopeptidase N